MFAVLLKDGYVECIASQEYDTYEEAESFMKLAFIDNWKSSVVDLNNF